MSYKYLILDLDNTLYPESSRLLQAIDNKIDDYLRQKLSLPQERMARLRHEYWKEYGTTLGGVVIHHGIDPKDYIENTYELDINHFIGKDLRLAEILGDIDLTKVVFSNSPRGYVGKVLNVLGIDQQIEAIYDIQFCNYLGKPNHESYQKVLDDLKVNAEECIFVDDALVNVRAAQKMGMTSVWLNAKEDGEVRWNIGNIYELPKLFRQISATELSA